MRGQSCPLAQNGPQATRQVSQRAAKATHLAAAIRDMLSPTPLGGARQPAWVMTNATICHCLTYDSRAMPISLVLPHARAVQEAVIQTLHVITGTDPATPSARQHAQFGLPTKCGGLEVHMPTRIGISARAGSLVEHGPAFRAAIRARDPAADVNGLDGVAAAIADGLPAY